MSEKFRIFIKDEDGDLYLKPVGDFDDEAAWEIIRALGKMYDGKGNVIIDTEKLQNVHLLGCATFRFQFYLCGVPLRPFVFQGGKTATLSPRVEAGSFIPFRCGLAVAMAIATCAVALRKRKSLEKYTGSTDRIAVGDPHRT